MNTWIWNTGYQYTGNLSTPTPSPSPSYSPGPTPSPVTPSPSPLPPASSTPQPSPTPSPSLSPSPTPSPLPSAVPPDNSQNPPAPYNPNIMNTNATLEGIPNNNFMFNFFNAPTAKDLTLYIPGYAYFQGIIYSHGNVKALGPIRIIGGIICKTPQGTPPGSEKSIKLEKGAMLTTNPDYLHRRLSAPNMRLKITKWEEKPTTLRERD